MIEIKSTFGQIPERCPLLCIGGYDKCIITATSLSIKIHYLPLTCVYFPLIVVKKVVQLCIE